MEHRQANATSIMKEVFKEEYKKIAKYGAIIPEDEEEDILVAREEVYVELAVKGREKKERNSFINNCSREFQLHRLHSLSNTFEVNTMLNNKNKSVIIDGIAGIGKTFLIENLVYKWAMGEIWNGIDGMPLIDYLFPFFCRDINALENVENLTYSELLIKTFPWFFRNVSFGEMDSPGKTVLIIVDGFDELLDLKDIRSPKTKLGHAMRELLDPKSFSTPYFIVAGRPSSCKYAAKFLRSSLNIEVMGFSPKSICNFIKNYAEKEHAHYDYIYKKINETDSLKALASVPVFLWIMCCVLREDSCIEIPKTSTDLYTLLFAVYLRDHAETSKGRLNDLEIKKIFHSDDVKKMIGILSEMSYDTLCKGEVVFTELEERKEALKACTQSGMIIKCGGGDFGDVKYQFRHLTIQEYLAAVHAVYKNISVEDLLSNEKLFGMIPLYFGLKGAFEKDSLSHKVVKLFVKHLILDPNIIEQTVVSPSIISLVKSRLRPDIFELDKMLLAALYEYRNPLKEKELKELLSYSPSEVIVDGYLSHEVKYAIHYILLLKDTSKWPLKNLTFKNSNLSPSNYIELTDPFVKSGNVTVIEDTQTREMKDNQIASFAQIIPYIQKVKLKIKKLESANGAKVISSNIISNKDKLRLQEFLFEHDPQINGVVSNQFLKNLSLCLPYIKHVCLQVTMRCSSSSAEAISSSILASKKDLKLKSFTVETDTTDGLSEIPVDFLTSLSPCLPFITSVIFSAGEFSSASVATSISDSIFKMLHLGDITLASLNIKCHNKLDEKKVISQEFLSKLSPCVPYLEKLRLSAVTFHGGATQIADEINNASIYNRLRLKKLHLEYLQSTFEENENEFLFLQEVAPCFHCLEVVQLDVNKFTNVNVVKVIYQSLQSVNYSNVEEDLLSLHVNCKEMSEEVKNKLELCEPFLKQLIINGVKSY